jgi:hypothetical protein
MKSADESTATLAKIVELTKSLPSDPAEYAGLSPRKRRAVRCELEDAVRRLAEVAQSLDTVRQPKHVFDPTNPKAIGEMVAHALLLQDKEVLREVVKNTFYGAGVYAIYYRGSFDCYKPIAGKDHPIYVGKADPEALHALTAEAQGTRLHARLKDHHRSISQVENLSLDDFECRYLVVRSAWVKTAEDILIDWFKPVWNNQMKICYGFGKHGDSAGTRKNERSPWDTLHPGRQWAKGGGNVPNKRSVERIRTDVIDHFKKHPPKG